MAVVFFDGFDDATSSTTWLTTKGWNTPTTNTFSTSATTRYSSGLSMQTNGTGPFTLDYKKTLDTPSSHVIVGFAFRRTDQSGSVISHVRFLNSGGSELFNVRPTAVSGTVGFNFTGPSAGYTVLTTTPSLAEPLVWDYWEFRVKISATVGEFECRRNGTQIHLATGLNTGAVNIGQIAINSYNSTNTSSGLLDDVYFMDASDGSTFLGEVRSVIVRPDDDTTQKEWVPSNVSSPSYMMLNETIPDSDTSYVGSTSNGSIDFYEMASLPFPTIGVAAARPLVFGRTVIGPVNITTILKAINNNTNQQTVSSPSSSYTYLPYGSGAGILTNNPITTAPWTAEEINTLRMGIKLDIP